MLAHHPITGKEIRVLKTQTHIHKDQRTLVWVDGSIDSHRYKTLLSNILLVGKVVADYYLFTEPSSEILAWLKKGAPRKKELIFLSQAIVSQIGSEELQNLGFQNVICLEEMSELYSYLDFSYTDITPLEDVVAAIATLLRMNRVFISPSYKKTFYSSSLVSKFGISFVYGIIEPCETWLIQQYYIPSQGKRGKEIKKCLQTNLLNPFIDHVLLLNETDLSTHYLKFQNSEKIRQIVIGERLTYKRVIQEIYEDIPPGDLIIFANSDIYFDDSLKVLWELNMDNKFLSLLRHEEETKQLFGPRSDSQDAWIVSAEAVKRRTWKWEELDFPFGKMGCDNALNLAMLKHKFLVVNPCVSIKAWHVHASGIRNYDKHDVIDKPIFLYVDPTGIQDLKVRQFSNNEKLVWEGDMIFSRVIKASNKHYPIFHSMVLRDTSGPWIYNTNSSNIYEPALEHLYSFSNAFVTPTGFVYDYNSLMVGNNEFLKEECSKEFVSHMTPCLSVETMLAVPFPDRLVADPYAFLVEYISKILRLRARGYKGTFWVPRLNDMTDILQLFKWNTDVMPVLPRDEGVVAYGERVVLLAPSAPRAGFVVHKEDITELRKWSYDWINDPTLNNAVIYVDGSIITEENAKEWASLFHIQYISMSTLRKDTFYKAVSHCLRGAGTLIVPYGYKHFFWMLPIGARIIEIQKDLDIHGDSAHMAGACDCPYTVILKSRGQDITELIEQVAVEQQEAFEKFSQNLDYSWTKLPHVYIPDGFEGFHGHSGDSFREMAKIWEERGYVSIIRTKQTPFCWLGEVGKTLLYDRPTWEWLGDTKYEKLLCGNPAPNGPLMSPWSFWPRRPRIVELLVLEGANENSWAERTKNLVFYGRVENNVQKKRRPLDLLSACDDFFMPVSVGDETPYKYSHEEYLRRLASARFGLCLAGYGSKCHREIECMAMGTVPVVAPDVDMSHYADPPAEGTHFLRLKSFESSEAVKVISEFDEVRWVTMSKNAHAWWLKNCSAEGMWNLTKKLNE